MRFLSSVAAYLGFSKNVYRGKSNARAYAIGDVHGCIDHLDHLLKLIEEELKDYSGIAYVIFLGDLIDRGGNSRNVIERVMNFRPANVRMIYLMGNHEEFLLKSLAGETETMRRWLEFGGDSCVLSYGLTAEHLLSKSNEDAVIALHQAIPKEHISFIQSFGDTFTFGDYVFVHAGIRPGLPLDRQVHADLRWIREPFLNYQGDHGFIVVHGHTVTETVDERANRIGIDTGAYCGGSLTALVIEDSERRYLSIGGQPEA